MEINIEPGKKQTVSDDPELAKVLAGIGGTSDDSASDDTQQDDNLQYEQIDGVVADQTPAVEEIAPEMAAPSDFSSTFVGDLDNIKTNALQDLRPLVDKVEATNEEKFDIYLLLLRSSDDESLIEPAYNTARMIEDEAKRANALLDVIKEIDYLKTKK